MVHFTSLRGRMLIPGDQGRYDREASRHSTSLINGSELRGRTVHKRRALAIPFKGLATFLSSFSLMFLYFPPAATGVRWRYGSGEKGNKSREQNSERSNFSRAGRRGQLGDTIGLPSLVCALLLGFLFMFWDHWKAIYPCVVRLVFGRVSIFASRTCFYGILLFFSLYIILFEIENF